MGFPVTPRILQLIKDGTAVFTGKPTKRPRPTKTRLVARPAGELLDSVTVPIPPSTNNLYVNLKRGGRVPSKEYTAWQKAVMELVARLRPPVSYPCKFFCLLSGKVFQQRDGDNCQKPLLDMCKKAGVIADDSLKYVRGGVWHYEPEAGEPTATIWFEPWE